MSERSVKSLNQIFLSKKNFDQITKTTQAPYGLVLVAGTGGSEKSSLIYSILKHIHRPGINITTVENPVKYHLNGINQIRTDIFPNGPDSIMTLHWCLLQDNQVLAIDEIQNKDEVSILVEASMTGHLVIGGIKANNVFDAIHRLFQWGLKPNDVLHSLIGVFAQCKVRKLCPQCKEKYLLSSEKTFFYFDTDGKTPIYLYRPKGCSFCNGTGFSGQIALHETLILNNIFKRSIFSETELMNRDKFILETDFQNMRYDGMKKALRGFTTIDEVWQMTI